MNQHDQVESRQADKPALQKTLFVCVLSSVGWLIVFGSLLWPSTAKHTAQMAIFFIPLSGIALLMVAPFLLFGVSAETFRSPSAKPRLLACFILWCMNVAACGWCMVQILASLGAGVA